MYVFPTLSLDKEDPASHDAEMRRVLTENEEQAKIKTEEVRISSDFMMPEKESTCLCFIRSSKNSLRSILLWKR